MVIVMNVFNYLDHTIVREVVSYTVDGEFLVGIWLILWKIIHPMLEKYQPKLFHSHIFAVMLLCRCSDTKIIVTSQLPCCAHEAQEHAFIFYNAWFTTALFRISHANFSFAVYQNQSIRVIKGDLAGSYHAWSVHCHYERKCYQSPSH